MKIIADKTRCAGHARCAAVSNELFQLDENGFIAFEHTSVPPGSEDLAKRGIRACPERALQLLADVTEPN